ncbi:hypothetical protein RB195_003633 [Necator americanus]|uniref:Uncharacterized protein n=1 Tax=Necator americanus TaxID=51031 RepID=A0ABR1DPG2_NECAM
MDNFDEEYDRLLQHFHDFTSHVEHIRDYLTSGLHFMTFMNSKADKETLELMEQREATRAASHQELTPKLARLERR